VKTFNTANDVAEYINSLSNDKGPIIIAVDGYGGSGKSTLCKELTKLIPDSMTIQTDDFIKYPHAPNDFEHDWTAIENIVLKKLKTASEVTTATYDWNSLGPKAETQDVKHIVLIDGIGLLEEKYLHYYDVKIWIDCPYETALDRGKKRDKEEQGSDHDELWDTVWGPGSKLYFDRAHPDTKADILYQTIMR